MACVEGLACLIVRVVTASFEKLKTFELLLDLECGKYILNETSRRLLDDGICFRRAASNYFKV